VSYLRGLLIKGFLKLKLVYLVLLGNQCYNKKLWNLCNVNVFVGFE